MYKKPQPTYLRFGRASSRWVSESYYVREDQVRNIISYFGVKPDIDAFATPENKRFPRWWGPGSKEGTDAFRKRWHGKLLLWLNPPYSRIPEVMRKICKEGTHAILVIPQWKRRKCWKLATKLSLACMTIPAKTKVFGRVDKACRESLWPVSVFLICGHNERCDFLSGFGKHLVTPHVHPNSRVTLGKVTQIPPPPPGDEPPPPASSMGEVQPPSTTLGHPFPKCWTCSVEPNR